MISDISKLKYLVKTEATLSYQYRAFKEIAICNLQVKRYLRSRQSSLLILQHRLLLGQASGVVRRFFIPQF